MSAVIAVALIVVTLLGAPLFAVIGAGALVGFERQEVDLSVVAIEFFGLSETPVLLVVPTEPVATRDAYEALAARRRTRLEHAPSRVLAVDDLRTFESIAASAVNDFEDVVFERHPDRRRIKQLLAASGALHALLTGTGSALFGLFPSSAALEQASERVRAEFPSVHLVRTTTCARL